MHRTIAELQSAALTEGGYGLGAVGADESVDLRRRDEETDHAYRMRLIERLDLVIKARSKLFAASSTAQP